ncbi:MAG: gfo/Idh/MocA family oxidoreductase [Candidatus Lokiarchaeota archaeon]|nr:gfo/Idh/MocA family oxidoreductase [Candidatus Lokiarchaeota archaeon]MBD3199918.1 gfo/Idh/MocA family oxidoreductase [Candidatus Lokiarchaeota archaeon]
MMKNFNEPIIAILIGAGNRGMTAYARYAELHPDELDFIAVAEPVEIRREKFADLHNIDPKLCFITWEDLLAEGKIADIAVICTQDQLHVEPTLEALEKGYDVLLEKPMAHTLNGCVKLVKKAEEKNQILGICHVLRYAPFFDKLYRLINDGLIGEIVNISHRENLGWWHMAHSYVRGNWRNVEESSPMILAKCCHDLDILYWIVGSSPRKISSMGNLMNFKKKNAPKGAPKYCVEGCPIQDTCLYYAPRTYIDIEPILQMIDKSEKSFFKFIANLRRNHLKILSFLSKIIPFLKQVRYWKEWPVEPLYHGHKEDYSDEAKFELLKTSKYGRCVYQCDNDVVDHQIVNIEFENGVTASLTMQGFSENEGRSVRVDGTKGTLTGIFQLSGEKIDFYDHFTGQKETLYNQPMNLTAHGGGDLRIVEEFLKSVKNRKTKPLTSSRESLESHLMAFAAEKSRLNELVIDMNDFRNKLGL